MKPTQILLDMDGVLADFFTSALKALNANSKRDPITPQQYVEKQEFAMDKVFNITASKFWQTIETNDFWQNLKPMEHADNLLSYLRMFKIPIVIASSPSFHSTCIPSKVAWLYHYYGIRVTDCMFGSKKYLMAKPGTLLIDDSQKNIDNFIHHEGQAVCIPSNWNTHNLTFADIQSKISPFFT